MNIFSGNPTNSVDGVTTDSATLRSATGGMSTSNGGTPVWTPADLSLADFHPPCFQSGNFLLAPKFSFPLPDAVCCHWYLLRQQSDGQAVLVSQWNGDILMTAEEDMELLNQHMVAVKRWADSEVQRYGVDEQAGTSRSAPSMP